MIKIILRLSLLLLFCGCSKIFFAQDKKIDSLMNVLKTAIGDTNKVNTLNNLSEQFWRTAKYAEAKKYADDALSLSEKLNFKRGIAKLEIALCKGKQLYDKRRDLKKKIHQREMDQALKSRQKR